jgi:oligopeptide/dipeptide ABC transporter ATP-binding protein
MKKKSENILEIENLKVYFDAERGNLPAVDGVSFSIKQGKILALVGESGCGKSVTAFSILQLIQEPGRICGGRIMFYPDDKLPIDITELSKKSDMLYHLRGGMISMIFQEPMTALSPVHTISNQICEAILLHQHVSRNEAEQITVDMLDKVGIPNPEMRLNQYPHEISGGMRQRVVIAMALVCRPELLIADEPTTALDVTIQAQILNLLKELQYKMNTSVLLITHDFGVVAQTADEVAVMYLGRIVEHSNVSELMKNPRHPYTMALLESLPSLNEVGRPLASIKGSVPPLTEIPNGCSFHPRCRYAKPGLCDANGSPDLEEISAGHTVACLRAEDIQKL